MTTQEQLKIFAAYLPYGLKVKLHEKDSFSNKIKVLSGVMEYGLCFLGKGGYFGFTERNFEDFKPILYDLSHLAKEELRNAGFTDHIDWLTNEREVLISRYGTEKYLSKTPYGHIQYLLSKHYNVFGIPAGDFIDKATIKTESND